MEKAQAASEHFRDEHRCSQFLISRFEVTIRKKPASALQIALKS
jgi:hypothetical protein